LNASLRPLSELNLVLMQTPQMTEDRRQRTEDRGQRTADGR